MNKILLHISLYAFGFNQSLDVYRYCTIHKNKKIIFINGKIKHRHGYGSKFCNPTKPITSSTHPTNIEKFLTQHNSTQPDPT
jgi:hypothetical protein